jgi:FkbM family methyltransferase
MQISIEDYEKIRPIAKLEYGGSTLLYHVPNRMALWRVQTLFTKEPCTIEWLQTIEAGSVLLDVGANVGMYTMIAAKLRRARVYAFEPESQNYALLNANIHVNGLHGQVTAFCVALSDQVGFDKLYLSEFSAGGSCHSLHEDVGFDLTPRKSPFVQGVFSHTIDAAITSGAIEVPNYIKLDVDGFEHKVLKGAKQTLRDQRVRSLIVELNPRIPEHRAIVDYLAEFGFRHDPQQVGRAARQEGAFKGIGEWIFTRDAGRPAADLNGGRVAHRLVSAAVKSNLTRSEQVVAHVLRRVRETAIETEPFPYAIVDDVFPDDYYRQIAQHFPEESRMVPLSETGRATGYKERLVVLFDDTGFARLDERQRQFWSELRGWLYSPSFVNGVVDRFRPYVAARIDELARRMGTVSVRGDAMIVSDKTRYAIGPHTDAPHRLITFLFYLPQDDRYRRYGTSIYKPNDPDFVCAGGPHYPFDRFTRIKTVGFVPNRLLIFVRTGRSFHGVEPIDENIERRLLVNNLRLCGL